MQILITGAAGMLGCKLAGQLLAQGELSGRSVTKLILHDVVAPEIKGSPETAVLPLAGDISDPLVSEHLVAEKPDVIFLLAAVVSGEAETDFDKGYRVNLDATRNLFEAVRRASYGPRVVFASSIAVYGAPFPDTIPDDFHLTPLTSYGAQKAMGELLLADYTRRGIFDGIGLRLPTICVRPGRPNKAASGFFSGIIREPLKGEPAALPVSDTVRHWFAGPRAAVGFLLHAATMDISGLATRPNVTMPGVSATVSDQIEALRRAAGDRAVALIRRQPDELVARIVAGWPQAFEARRARDLGFVAESSFDEIVRAHVEDEHGGNPPIAS